MFPLDWEQGSTAWMDSVKATALVPRLGRSTVLDSVDKLVHRRVLYLACYSDEWWECEKVAHLGTLSAWCSILRMALDSGQPTALYLGHRMECWMGTSLMHPSAA